MPLVKRIIPCMDIKNGRVVKGTHFKDLVDSGDPLQLAKKYAREGADELVLLDIVATVEERKNRIELVKAVAEAIAIPFAVGGGVSTLADIKELLDAGADKVSIGSAAVTDPEFVKNACDKFGSQAIVISIDPKRTDNGWDVYIKGGRENSGVEAVKFAQQMETLGVGELLVNSLDRDGTKRGFDVELLGQISSLVNIPVIASSGAGNMDNFVEVFAHTHVTAALGASVFHNDEFTVAKLKIKLRKEGIEVRI